jgi:hypothetical protein
MRPILIAYSSPADEDRLRLDREHRRVEESIAATGASSTTVDRKHATTLEDLARALASKQYEIVHFSGHGDSTGFCFDSDAGDAGTFVTAAHLAKLLQTTQRTLSAIVLISCYSADTAKDLLSASPYVISITGPADDTAAIDFVGHFYEHYFRTSSVESAFSFASAYVNERLDAILGHSSKATPPTPRIAVYPHSHRDPIYVDLTQALPTIERLDITADRFASILTRKLRVHRWIFDGERENAILPIAGYFARFSWKNAKDVVHCHWVYRPKPSLEASICEVISDLIVVYNDVYVSSYRANPRPVSQQDPRDFRFGLAKLHQLMDHFLKDNDCFQVLESIDSAVARMLRATCHSNLSMADRKVGENDLASAAIYAETALSAVHDAIEALVEGISC